MLFYFKYKGWSKEIWFESEYLDYSSYTRYFRAVLGPWFFLLLFYASANQAKCDKTASFDDVNLCKVYSPKKVTHNFDWFYPMCVYVNYV